jgi:hypothetical protein
LIVELTQRDFEERLGRIADGSANDEDQRLVRLYRSEGYRASDDPVDGSWLASAGTGAVGEDIDQGSEQGDDYTGMEYRDLQTLARQRGLNAGGSAADLTERLREHDQQRTEQE